MATPLQVSAGIIASATQIADCFLFASVAGLPSATRRAQQLPQLAGIAGVGRDPLAGFARHQRRRNHLAAHPGRRHLTLQGVAARPGFVTRADRTGRFSLVGREPGSRQEVAFAIGRGSLRPPSFLNWNSEPESHRFGKMLG